MTDSRRPRLGLSMPTWPLRGGAYATWPEMRQLARNVEALGVDTLWVSDHLLRSVPGRPAYGFHECWTILAATAEATSRIELGPFVACTAFRNPGLLAKMAVTLDEVSGGRVVLALGSGDPRSDDSWSAFGFETDRSVSRHEEVVELVARLFRDPPVTFDGAFHHFAAAQLLPRGPRAAGPPVWVAAKGDRSLGIAARWGDAVNVNVPLVSVDDVRAIAARVAVACDAVGRNPSTLGLTGWARLALREDGSADPRPGRLAGSRDEVVATIRSFADAGLSHLTLYAGDADDPSPLPALTTRTLSRLAPYLEALQAG